MIPEVHPDLAPIADRVSRTVADLNARFGGHVKYIRPSSLDHATGPLGHKNRDTIFLNMKAVDPDFWKKREKEWKGLLVDPTLEGTIIHEYGHVLFGAAQRFDPERFNREVHPISSDLSTATTTPYGMEHPSESEAESFAAVVAGAVDGPFAESQMAHARRHVAAAMAILADGPKGRTRRGQVHPRDRRRNPSADERRRAAERAGDPVAVLRERLRRGEVTTEQVRIAAALGDERARALEPDVRPIFNDDPALHPARRSEAVEKGWIDAVSKVGKAIDDLRGVAVSFAADCAEHTLPLWESYPSQPPAVGPPLGPRDAIEEARRWVRERRRSWIARAAAEALSISITINRRRRAGLDVLSTISAAHNAALAAAAPSYAVGYAARAAFAAALAVGYAAPREAAHAAHAAPREAAREAARSAEHEWQRRRLIAYVLREERPL